MLKLSPASNGEAGSPGDQTAASSIEIDARPSDAIALALRTGSSIWMLEEVVSDASIPVDAEADAQEQDNFRRFLDSTSPADLVRHLKQPPAEADEPGDAPTA